MEAAIEYYYNMDPGQIAQLTPKQQQPSLSREAVSICLTDTGTSRVMQSWQRE